MELRALRPGEEHPSFPGYVTAADIGKPFGLSGIHASRYITMYLSNFKNTDRPTVRVEALLKRLMTSMSEEAALESLCINGFPTYLVEELGGFAVRSVVEEHPGLRVWINYWSPQAAQYITSLIQKWVDDGRPEYRKRKKSKKAPTTAQPQEETSVEQEMSIEELELDLGHVVHAAKQEEINAEQHHLRIQQLTIDLANLQRELEFHTGGRHEALKAAQVWRTEQAEMCAVIDAMKAELLAQQEPKKFPKNEPTGRLKDWLLQLLKDHAAVALPREGLHYREDIYPKMVQAGIRLFHGTSGATLEKAEEVKALNDFINKKLLPHPNVEKVVGKTHDVSKPIVSGLLRWREEVRQEILTTSGRVYQFEGAVQAPAPIGPTH